MPVLHRRVRRTFILVEADQARVEAEHDRKADGQRPSMLPEKRIGQELPLRYMAPFEERPGRKPSPNRDHECTNRTTNTCTAPHLPPAPHERTVRGERAVPGNAVRCKCARICGWRSSIRGQRFIGSAKLYGDNMPLVVDATGNDLTYKLIGLAWKFITRLGMALRRKCTRRPWK